MGAALRFKTSNVPRQQGERARVKVVRGPDRGIIFIITGGRAVVGRGDESDIVLADLKASRQHAEIVVAPDGRWMVRDLNSANGVLHNGVNVKSAPLQRQDSVTIGETVLEFMTAEQATAMLVAPVRDLKQIEAEEKALEAQKKKIQEMARIQGLPKAASKPSEGAEAATPAPGPGQHLNQLLANKKLLLAAGGAAVLFLLLPDNPSPSPVPKPASPGATVSRNDGKAPNTINLREYLPDAGVPTVVKSTDILFKNGFREYWQGNWLRARAQFETVLQILPNHPLALLYLRNCENQIADEVKWHLEKGRKDSQTGRLKSARGHFEAVLRLLYREKTSPAYIDADEQLKKVLKEMKVEVEES
jgi:pSer/pThr/pTyr-binding forkhead associated (FHA) protein